MLDMGFEPQIREIVQKRAWVPQGEDWFPQRGHTSANLANGVEQFFLRVISGQSNLEGKLFCVQTTWPADSYLASW